MTLLTSSLIDALRGHLDRHHVVVWYDPRGEYAPLVAGWTAATLAAADGRPATIARHDPARGFLALRHDLEPLWAAAAPPRLLLYVAQAQAQSPHERALLEFEKAGAVLQPGAQPPEHDTALAAVARRALLGVLPAALVEQLGQQLEADPPQLTLAELEAAIARGQAGFSGVLSHLYPQARHAAELALCFLADAAQDEELARRGAVGQAAALLEDTLGVPLPAAGAAALREAAVRRVLLTDVVLALGDDAPPLLALAEQPAARRAAAELAADWRAREALAPAYERWAGAVEAAANLAGRLAERRLGPAALARATTFAAGERALQTALEEGLLAGATAELVALAEARRDGFWARRSVEIRARWSAILSAGRLLLEAGRVVAGLRVKDLPAAALWAAYTTGEGRAGGRPWCLLDRAQRQFERDELAIDLDDPRYDAHQRLAGRARAAYAQAAGALAERFVRAYEAARFELPGQRLQADVYARHVAPAVAERVAYILVDAFRFEMAHELWERLSGEWRMTLTAAVATPPTITEVGMAALMPGAERGLVLAAAKDKLQVKVGGAPLADRQERLEHFGRAAPAGSVALKLEELLPLTNKKLGERLNAAQVILVTATDEIDGRCETAPALARKELDAIFDELRRALGTLFRRGVGRAIITADHGYLFGQALTPAEVMARPDGQALVAKRRVWVGRGGQALPGALRAPLAAFGLAGEAGDLLELVTPYNLAIFKAAGANREYFHGGLSLPELVVPVLTVYAGPDDAPAPVGGKIDWSLRLGSKTISSQVVTVAITGQATGLFALPLPRVTVEIRTASGPIATLIGAAEGYQPQTNDIRLAADPDDARRVAANTAILQLPQPPAERTASLVLLDAVSGGELARLDDIAITIAL